LLLSYPIGSRKYQFCHSFEKKSENRKNGINLLREGEIWTFTSIYDFCIMKREWAENLIEIQNAKIEKTGDTVI